MPPSTYPPGYYPSNPVGPLGTPPGYLPRPAQPGQGIGGEVSVQFWLIIIGMALFLVAVFAAYKFHAKRVKSKTESEEIALNDADLGSGKLTRVLTFVWAINWLLLL